MRRTVRIDHANAGRRLDAYLRKLLPDVSLGTVMKWIRTGVVRVNARRAKAAARLAEGDELTLPDVLTEPEPHAKRPPRLPPPAIVHEDDDLLVLDKPAGLACHAGTGHTTDSLAARLTAYLDRAHAPPGHRPGLAQRLDRGVSGLVPAGKHAAALRALAGQVERNELDKVYLALVDGAPPHDRGSIDVPLRIDDEPRGDRPRAHPDRERGLPAHSEYRVIERLPDAALLEVRITTGRTHQIRAHLRAIGHPILGDPRYGLPARNQALRGTYGLARPFLHAARLTLSHPATGETLRYEAPLPADLARVLAGLRGRISRGQKRKSPPGSRDPGGLC